MSRLARSFFVTLAAGVAAACADSPVAPTPDLDPTADPSATALSPTGGKPQLGLDRPVSIQRYALVPPNCFPVCPAVATDRARGLDILVRRRTTAINHVSVAENITPGNVYVYVMTPYDRPEHCVYVEDRFLGVPYPCRANGPLDRLDGLDPNTGFYVATYGGVVARGNRVRFRVDVVGDDPTEVIFGSAVTNPLGMMFYSGVMDKGPELPEGHPLREAQRTTLMGGCQGPPAFGPLPCGWVHIAAHAPTP